MGTCVLDVRITPESGPSGSSVTLTVRPSDAAAVAAVRVGIVGYGLEETLYRNGDGWSATTAVPWEASPGEYLLDIYAVDAAGNRLASAHGSFIVTG